MDVKYINMLSRFAAQHGAPLCEAQLAKLQQFASLVLDKNESVNLTSITDDEGFAIKHLADSLAGAEALAGAKELLDIGSGAGFPSVPLAIALPDLHVTALDSTAKKTDFLKNAASELGLSNLSVIYGRAEEQTSLKGRFDAVTARAVASLNILLELALPLLKIGGVFVAYKADDKELCGAQNAMRTLGAKLVETTSFSLPNGDPRTLIVIQKAQPTPPRYPRRYGAIKSNPL